MRNKKLDKFLCIVMVASVFAVVILGNVFAHEDLDVDESEKVNVENDIERDSSSTVIHLVKDPRQIDGTAYAFVTIEPIEASNQATSRNPTGYTGVVFVLLIIVAIIATGLVYLKLKKRENESLKKRDNKFRRVLAKGIVMVMIITIFSVIISVNASAESSSVDIVIDTDTTWGTGTYIYDNILITNNSNLIFDGMVTLTTTNLIIDIGSSISADGKGYSGSDGPGAGAYGFWGGGGGGYGGKGGNSYDGVGGPSYGSITAPTDFGSGGGASYVAGGGAGGGAIIFNVGGTLTVNGTITANGNHGGVGWYYSYPYDNFLGGGGGSGGSIYLTTNILTGSGSITANGGVGYDPSYFITHYGGGGAGGRIAICYNVDTFTGTKSAYGGFGHQYGGAGTIFLKSSTQAYGDLLIDNNNNTGLTPFVDVTDTFDSITVMNRSSLEISNHDIVTDLFTISSNGVLYMNTNLSINNGVINSGGTLTLSISNNEFNLTVSEDLNIGPTGKISADGKGYGASEGPGVGGDGFWGGGGGGYGGKGGNSYDGVGGPSYGSITEPTDFGSGGGASYVSGGGAGGGGIRLNVGGTLTVNGTITANGNHGGVGWYYSYPYDNFLGGGGGSGGSIYLTTGILTGSGSITANGGVGYDPSYFITHSGGGGAGGRIALYYDIDTFTGTKSTYGGGGNQYGGAGTIFSKSSTQAYGDLLIDNNNNGGLTPFVDMTYSFDSINVINRSILEITTSDIETDILTIGNNSDLYLNSHLTAKNATVESGGIMTVSITKTVFDLTVMGDFTIETGGIINLDYKGYAGSDGPGMGAYGFWGGGGAGYGGKGGNGYSGAGGPSYGSESEPTDFGSGGGACVSAGGGAGGGAIRLYVTGIFTVNGTITTNGNDSGYGTYYIYPYTHYLCGGGGSGGSVFITTNVLTGSGSITANGGYGDPRGYPFGFDRPGGGGAGGRIAIHYNSNTFAGTISVNGGEGVQKGEDGTIFYKTPSGIPVTIPPIADFIYSPEKPRNNEEIAFDASSSYDEDGYIVSYNWDFGDNSTSSLVNPIHTYASGGKYTVTLTVTDNESAQNNIQKDIYISLILLVPYSYQGDTNWCWANSMSMVLQYYGHHIHPWDIAEHFEKGHDGTFPTKEFYKMENYFAQSPYYLEFKEIMENDYSFEHIKNELDKGYPVMYSAKIAPPLGHTVIITGYCVDSGNQYFYMNDPSGHFVDTCWGLSPTGEQHINIQVPANYLFTPEDKWIQVIRGTPSPTTATITLIDESISKKLPTEWVEDIGTILWLDNGLTWNLKFDEKTWEPDDNLPFPSNSGLEFKPYIYNIDITSHFYQLDIIIENESTQASITYHITKISMGSDIVIHANSCSMVSVSYEISFQLYPNFFTEGWYNIDIELWESNPDYNDNNDLYDRITDIRFRIDDEEYVESLTDYIIENVEELDILEGTENSLISKLKNALSSFENGQDNAAINKLEAFINEVEAQRGKKLTEEEADTLIVYAQIIIDYYTVL